MTLHVENADRAPRLVLHCLLQQGRSAGWTWSWPSGQGRLSFAEVFTQQATEGDEFLQQVGDIELYCAGSKSHPSWWLRNQSQALKCTVNDEFLPFSQQTRLNEGDEIELGLARFVAQFALGNTATLELGTAQSEMREAGGALPTSSAAERDDLVVGFDLTDLARLHADSTSSTDPFSGLLDTMPIQDLVANAVRDKSASRTEPALPAAQPPVASKPGIPHSTGLDDNSTKPSATSIWDREDDFNTDTSDDVREAEISAGTLMSALHSRYLRILQEPSHADDEVLWVGVERSNKQEHSDPMQKLIRDAGNQSSLDDLLGQPHQIEEVMDGMDSLGETNILDMDPFPNVLQLFAPEHLRGDAPLPKGQPLHQIPSLTRKEHHTVSIDSVMDAAPAGKSSRNGSALPNNNP